MLLCVSDCDECGWDGGDDAGSFAGYEAGGEPIEPLHVSKSAIVQDYEDLVKKHVVRCWKCAFLIYSSDVGEFACS